MTRKVLASLSLLAIASMAVVAAYKYMAHQRHSTSLIARMEKIVPIGKHTEVPCAEVAATHPLVLLALGQSNAGNHGSLPDSTEEAVTLIAEGKCIRATDPLPGGTGQGGSIWHHLPALLSTQKEARPVALSVLAVDATAIADWITPNSPLSARLVSHVVSMERLGLPPDIVLWQQGEADAQLGTSSEDYSTGLARLAKILSEVGVNAPIFLALSTICQTKPNAAIRSAIDGRISSNPRFRLGPDTDTLLGSPYRDGCHLTAIGLDSAAKMWAAAISAEFPAMSVTR